MCVRAPLDPQRRRRSFLVRSRRIATNLCCVFFFFCCFIFFYCLFVSFVFHQRHKIKCGWMRARASRQSNHYKFMRCCRESHRATQTTLHIIIDIDWLSASSSVISLVWYYLCICPGIHHDICPAAYPMRFVVLSVGVCRRVCMIRLCSEA